MKNISLKFIVSILFSMTLLNCQNDNLGSTIFDTTNSGLDSTSYTYAFDKYLETAYLKPFNLQFAYKMEDVATDMNYNLVPASLINSEKLAVLTKYLWFDVYDSIAGPEFLKKYGPRMIHLIGSPAYNPANGTIVLGLAEAGIKVSLYRVNSIDTSDPNMLNEYYFKTMHHEFAHILHQTKIYPKTFNLISYKYYDPFAWQDRTEEEANALGFASAYGGSQVREDFVEIIANYIVKTDAQWATILANGAKGTDVDGDGIILQKLQICRDWFKDEWGINLDDLRAEVQYKQAHIDMQALLSQIK
jgi:substrate import-associated zinc metallohydrolase lipoprotein